MGPYSHSEDTGAWDKKAVPRGTLHMGQKEDLRLAAHQGAGEVCVGRGPSTTREGKRAPASALFLLPSLCFMTCFMSMAWRLPCCHGNQPAPAPGSLIWDWQF